MTRREFLGIAALYLGAAVSGAIGGMTSTEAGRKPERQPEEGGEEPP